MKNGCRQFEYADSQLYLDALRNGSETSRELEHFIANITVGESDFFRDSEQIRFLRENRLPALTDSKRRNGFKMLRIWSAGCSLGQELYSVAILLEELMPDIDDWTIHLLGTDINIVALRQAISGRYSAWSLRSMTEKNKSRYFRQHESGDYALLPRIRKRARFFHQNLSEDSFPGILAETNAQDLILCRNVLGKL